MKRITRMTTILLLALFWTTTAHALCVSVHEANLRTGPGTNYEKSWTVYMYMPFKKLETKGEWYKVQDLDGDVHWIHSKLVSEDIQCAVVKAEKVNVRSGPDTSYDKVPPQFYEKYHSFQITETKGKWVKIHDEVDNQGWISTDFLWIP